MAHWVRMNDDILHQFFRVPLAFKPIKKFVNFGVLKHLSCTNDNTQHDQAYVSHSHQERLPEPNHLVRLQ